MNDQERQSYSEAFKLLENADYRLLIYGALRRLHVTKSNPFYDDLIQEGCCAFAKKVAAAKKAGKKPEAVMPYVFQGVVWAMIDYMRKQRAIDGHVYETTDDTTEPWDEIADQKQSTEKMEVEALISTLSGICTVDELNYLHCDYYLGLNVSEIARRMGVSRKTVYRLRKQIAHKLEDLQ
ncbi:sigma-70 family RNA polymerase sigma factor [Lentilactobacillus raoultii]|uniref:Sigma-70 family RNA polymerase sigma factor n=1 Tax=Lentilactobacillus raoultii TaxID=1987503 RepID=A0ABW3PH42_9LACO|nr:sigma-70 family RNA polymerase sigma factor [Lentilactobacillus raoultii]